MSDHFQSVFSISLTRQNLLCHYLCPHLLRYVHLTMRNLHNSFPLFFHRFPPRKSKTFLLFYFLLMHEFSNPDVSFPFPSSIPQAFQNEPLYLLRVLHSKLSNHSDYFLTKKVLLYPLPRLLFQPLWFYLFLLNLIQKYLPDYRYQ